MVTITRRLLKELKNNTRNARTHSKKQIHQIAASIKQFGFLNPVLIDEKDVIMCGHGRVAAAKELGIEEVPTVRIEHLSEAQKRAYVLADNKIAMKAGWDPRILQIELQHLTSIELDFDPEITGFETPEIDLLIDQSIPGSAQIGPEDLVHSPSKIAVTQLGDIWQLGDHHIICGDARDEQVYAALMGDERARTVFADPPYNVPIDGHVSGLGKVKHREFVMGSGEMSEIEFTQFLADFFAQSAAYSLDGGIHFICMDWRHVGETLAAGKTAYSELKNVCVWVKDNAGMGSFYRSRHELIFVYKNGKARHINNVELGKYGRYRTNVWEYPGVVHCRSGQTQETDTHPTIKPVALVMEAIKDSSRRGEIVLDPFGGSGTTLIAAEKTKRKARLIELDPLYCDLTIRRWEELTGQFAVHGVTGASFTERAEQACVAAQQAGGTNGKAA